MTTSAPWPNQNWYINGRNPFSWGSIRSSFMISCLFVPNLKHVFHEYRMPKYLRVRLNGGYHSFGVFSPHTQNVDPTSPCQFFILHITHLCGEALQFCIVDGRRHYSPLLEAAFLSSSQFWTSSALWRFWNINELPLEQFGSPTKRSKHSKPLLEQNLPNTKICFTKKLGDGGLAC